MQVVRLMPLFALLACPGPDTNATKDSGDPSGNPDDSGDTGANCEVHLTSISPTDGAVSVFYRDLLVLSFDGDGSAATIAVTDDAGTAVAVTEAWQDGNVQVWLDAELSAATTYDVAVSLCGNDYATSFTTSDVGKPLEVQYESMVGRTYAFSLNEANITTPSIIEGFDDDYFTQPLLFMIQEADESGVTFLGAPGVKDGSTYSQDTEAPTWDFPAADFTEQPYFETHADYIELAYRGTPIPISDFAFTGVFLADGSAIVEATVEGLVDTREMYEFLGLPENPEAICDYASGFGVYCEECPDGNAYCLYLVGEDITANEQAGLTLTVVE